MLFPLKDAELVNWLNEFAGAVERYAAILGFTHADVLGIKNDAAMLHYLVCIDLPAYEEALSSRSAYKQLIKYGRIGELAENFPVTPSVAAPPVKVEPGIVLRLHQIIFRIKSSPNYTDALGEELGFDGRELETELRAGNRQAFWSSHRATR